MALDRLFLFTGYDAPLDKGEDDLQVGQLLKFETEADTGAFYFSRFAVDGQIQNSEKHYFVWDFECVEVRCCIPIHSGAKIAPG